jgi:hypothetical protein
MNLANLVTKAAIARKMIWQCLKNKLGHLSMLSKKAVEMSKLSKLKRKDKSKNVKKNYTSVLLIKSRFGS